MTRTEILENLCSYDPRSPDYADYLECMEGLDEKLRKPRQSDCACDNCFYGRDALAVALLDALDELEDAQAFTDDTRRD